MIEHRLKLAAMGWLTFPAPASGEKKSLKSAKYSNGARWGATTDPAVIRQDLARWPDANNGVVCGPESGIFVVEADTKEAHGVDGIAAWHELQAKHGRIPDTLTAISPGWSPHYYFKYPDGVTIANSQGVICPGVDVRGEGGMVLAPPSIRPGKGRYRWLNDLPVAEAPAWLIKLAQKRQPTISERALASIRPIVLDCQSGAYGRAALNREISALASVRRPGRNAALNVTGFRLFQLVAGGELDDREVERSLIQASQANGLVADDNLPSVIATIRSARDGLQFPRSARR